MFAELLEQGTRSTLKIPSAYPTPAPSAALLAAQALEAGQMGLDAMRALGLNPAQALQHPGFYYYMAARCTERRRDRFLSAVEAEVSLLDHGVGGGWTLMECAHACIERGAAKHQSRIRQREKGGSSYDRARSA